MLRWDGQFVQVREHLAEIRRVGVSGVGFKALGEWGDTFEVLSTVDATNLTMVAVIEAAYKSLITLGPQAMIVDGIDTGNVKVIDVVVPGPPIAGACLVGGLNAPNGSAYYEVKAKWRLTYL